MLFNMNINALSAAAQIRRACDARTAMDARIAHRRANIVIIRDEMQQHEYMDMCISKRNRTD